jgi:POT family proton-dependent oligopeptide transporter|tara:strand:- start:494 stop:1996 length:1503 start_codon:yes stop_codon:yes gene_type:complete
MNNHAELQQKTIFGHPIGLFVLFFTELWERFSYYGMRAILVLYLVSETSGDNPGMGWSDSSAIALYGWYTMFVYLATIPGGILADRFLGQRKSVMLGGLLLCFGHGILAVEALWAFYTGLTFIVLGVGCLKGNISTMVGGLYSSKDNNKRDMGFYIFYMGINVGAAISAIVVGYIGETYNWHYGFGLAGIGMAIGQLVYWRGQKYLSHVGNMIELEPSKEEKKNNLFLQIFKKTNSLLGFSITAIIGLYVGISGDWNYGLLIIGIAFAVGFAILVYNDGNEIEKDRILVTYLAFLIVIVFWGAFEQAGGLMNLYASQKTDLALGSFMVPASWFQSVNAIFILIFATAVGSFWIWWKKSGYEHSSLFKMALGVIIMGFGFFFMSMASNEVAYDSTGEITKKSAMYWLVLAYLFHTIGELCASPVALSFITKLAPARWGAFMMGAYFAATGLGNKVAGLIGENASEIGDYETFVGITVFCSIFGLLVILILKPLKRLVHGAE